MVSEWKGEHDDDDDDDYDDKEEEYVALYHRQFISNLLITHFKYLFTGYSLLLLILFIASAAVAYLIILPIINDTSSALIDFVKTYW